MLADFSEGFDGAEATRECAGRTVAKEMNGWVEAGKIKYREEMIDGLEQAPRAFVELLRGEGFGKRVIRVGPDDQLPLYSQD